MDTTMEKASDYARKAADKAGDVSAQTAEMLSEKGQKMMKHGRSYVSDHPMASLGIAVTVGMMLNRMLSER